MCPNPIWTESPIRRPLVCSRVSHRKKTNLVQQVCGTLLYYAINIDNTILLSLSDISSEQSKATKNKSKHVTKLLNYLASNPNAEIHYRDSGMQLDIHYDTL